MKRTFLIIFFASLSLWSRHASAFWWSDSPEIVSGLDVTAGFDVNTITTVSGTVVTLPQRKGDEQHTVMTLAAPQGAVTVVLGPWWYWEKQAFPVTANQALAITGSLAQGKDGVLYLFAQRLAISGSGETVTLRSESGTPLWSRSGSAGQNGNRPQSGGGARYGGGSRGGGMRGGRR